MNPAERQLDLLAIFYYLLGVILILFSFIPLIYFTFIWRIISNPEIMRGEQAPPAFIGPILLVVGGVIAVMVWVWAGLIMLAGRFLQKRKNRIYCLVMAAIACMFQPFGTILGVFSIVILMRPDVELLFRGPGFLQPPPLPITPVAS